MNSSYALLLGIVQGLGEFLPISSSAHLVLLPFVMKFSDPGPAFDVALHVGTAIALVLYFWKDIITLVRGGIALIVPRVAAQPAEKRMALLIGIGTIPAAIIGFFGEKFFENTFRHPVSVAFFLMTMGLYLWYAEKKQGERDSTSLTISNVLFIGLYQAVALIPGVSRSGITMTAGMLCGLSRAAAARFSFLLAAPIICAAGVLKAREVIKIGLDPTMITPFAVGCVMSAVIGYCAIGFLLRYVQRYSLRVFVWYRLALGAAIMVLFVVR